MNELLLGIFLAGCGWTDARKREVSLLWLLCGAVAGGICMLQKISLGNFFSRLVSMEEASGIFVGIFLLVVAVLSKGQIGLGDGLGFFVSGLFLDFWKNSLLLLGGLGLLLFRVGFEHFVPKKTPRQETEKNTEQPLFPFVFAAYIGGLLWMQKG
jgi:leader peptidase (prepilin peptidase)/N-methyltransferase